jgi:prepilin-type N-terminal cleavage/methylation domain-containing protein
MANDVRSVSGFTLIEVLVVMSMLVIVAAFTLLQNIAGFKSSTVSSATYLLVTALQKARAQAQNGICIGISCIEPVAHGVHITSTQLIIFQGTSFTATDSGNEYVNLPAKDLSVSGLTDIVFLPYSANAVYVGTTLLSDSSGHFASTTVEGSGGITTNK